MNAKPLKSVFKIIGIVIFVFIISSCNQNAKSESYALEPVAVTEDYKSLKVEESVTSPNDLKKPEFPKDLKIIKSASARYKVQNVKLSTQQIKAIAIQLDAYISDLRFQNNLYNIENRFTIKVPAQHFDVLLDSINAVVEFVEYENITTKDVTEEYVDIETRLKTKLEVKQRYETILRKNAKTVKDILATEEKLRVIQEEIESAQGRLKYLNNKVAYSTIQVDLYETVEYTEEPISYTKTFWDKTKDGLSFGWQIIENLLLGMIYIWPIVIGIGLLVWFIRKRLRRKL
ncbi:MAG: DUF4349 domain-containing protein [Flavobacteriaceae bacterium]|nr:DUF4349 domain-containing protein [Flavobacteriaceae bacterium]